MYSIQFVEVRKTFGCQILKPGVYLWLVLEYAKHKWSIWLILFRVLQKYVDKFDKGNRGLKRNHES